MSSYFQKEHVRHLRTNYRIKLKQVSLIKVFFSISKCFLLLILSLFLLSLSFLSCVRAITYTTFKKEYVRHLIMIYRILSKRATSFKNFSQLLNVPIVCENYYICYHICILFALTIFKIYNIVHVCFESSLNKNIVKTNFILPLYGIHLYMLWFICCCFFTCK
jgi:hypothetical protein